MQNEFTTEGGKLHDAVKGVMSRYVTRNTISSSTPEVCKIGLRLTLLLCIASPPPSLQSYRGASHHRKTALCSLVNGIDFACQLNLLTTAVCADPFHCCSVGTLDNAKETLQAARDMGLLVAHAPITCRALSWLGQHTIYPRQPKTSS